VNFGERKARKTWGIAKLPKKKYFSFMDFGLLILVGPLVWFIVSWARQATNETTPKGEPKTGNFIMYLFAIVLLVLGAFIITGMGSPR